MTTTRLPQMQVITIIGSGDTINAAIMDGQTQANQHLDIHQPTARTQIVQAQTLQVSPLAVGLLDAFSTPRFYHIISIVMSRTGSE